MAAIGVPIGLAALAAAAQFAGSMLLGVTPHDPLAYVLSAVAVVGLALAAAWLPARRATRVDPMQALRQSRASDEYPISANLRASGTLPLCSFLKPGGERQ